MAQKAKRYNFAVQNCQRDWKSVIFSDESAVQLHSNILKIWSKNGKSRKFKKNKFSLKTMLWDSISYNGTSKLCFFNGSVNSDSYIKTLKSHLLPFTKVSHCLVFGFCNEDH